MFPPWNEWGTALQTQRTNKPGRRYCMVVLYIKSFVRKDSRVPTWEKHRPQAISSRPGRHDLDQQENPTHPTFSYRHVRTVGQEESVKRRDRRKAEKPQNA